MLGLGSSMFTALFVTRVIFNWLVSKRLIKERLVMLQLIHKPNINWMSYRPVFLTISAILIVGGLTIFFTRDDVENNKYDIEFTGGTSVQINLKEGANLSRQDVEDRIQKIGLDLSNPALAASNVYSVGKSGSSFEITTTATNKTSVTVTFPQSEGQIQHTVDSITAAIAKAQAELNRKLGNLTVTQTGTKNPSASSGSVLGTPNGGQAFVISTSETSPSLVKKVLSSAFPKAGISEPKINEVVNNAIKTAFADELEIQQNLIPEVISKEKITNELVDSYPELADFLGGIKIECKIKKAATARDIDQRLKLLRFKPDMQALDWNTYKILSPNLRANQSIPLSISALRKKRDCAS